MGIILIIALICACKGAFGWACGFVLLAILCACLRGPYADNKKKI